MRISVNVEAVFSGWDFFDAMEAVGKKQDWTPSNFGHGGIRISMKKTGKDQSGLEKHGYCTKFISLVDPDKRHEVQGSLRVPEVAKILGCKNIMIQWGMNSRYPQETQS